MVKPLSKQELNVPGTVAFLRGSDKDLKSLKDLGLRTGSQITVLHRGEGDSLLVAIGDTRIGINFELAKNILVN
ncbi:ferrous iron transport protein A [Mesosutterella sp. OilRF-GAM-744-9]|uniref:Ferrous iron transport protein A n=1 Tax=Mesosutterella porci TaxID=2915351 RepID=A0ABS9MQN6_9BURK|nr:FeoA family protein [Mesosutterella sp. oilRF-744-WT-GAM-9]MCG5030936.1 ferrous iron transport protein A [Mesosutterella sp. oilRF-744-WT-GAM-9]